ncbi:MAG: HNH endonuclease [Chloroflexi bacterium]|nr:HNH endonuclease [Chloroflexota bacterium]
MSEKLRAPVLVLNANYEPLNVSTTRRAIGLIFSEKASLILNGRGFIKTVSDRFPIPSVIRLDKMIKRPRPAIKLNKQEIFRRDNYTCQYCGKKTKPLTLDHVIPRRLGGSHTWGNLVTACAYCNHRKGGRTIKEANLSLRSSLSAPSASAKYIFRRYLGKNEEWVPYIEGW